MVIHSLCKNQFEMRFMNIMLKIYSARQWQKNKYLGYVNGLDIILRGSAILLAIPARLLQESSSTRVLIALLWIIQDCPDSQ